MRNLSYILLCMMVCTQACRKSDYEIPVGPVVISDHGTGIGDATWRANVDYLIDGKVYVNDGQLLTIEPGAVIRFKAGEGEEAGALIVARGGRIMAEGTEERPIVFTAESDDLAGSLPPLTSGLWGGIYILGSAPINTASGEDLIEGIPSSEPRAVYGGLTSDDNSGVFKYVSIRHGGTRISDVNDINGLTLGGVGSGTTIEHVEVMSCQDDGFEIFGGTVTCKYLVSAFNGDDAFDIENGYVGRLQFLVAIQGENNGNTLVEFSDRENHPRTSPVIANGTFIGQGSHYNRQCAVFNSSAGGYISNCLFINQDSGVAINYQQSQLDSYTQFNNGRLSIRNNIFFDVAGNSGISVFSAYTNLGFDITSIDQEVKAHFAAGQNVIYDPGIAASAPYNLIPENSVSDNLDELPDGMDLVLFKGAVGSNNWVKNWTYLDQSGFLK
ncbi:hypothetical protein [Saccharicrinis fermentans]|uniref:T9SS C-terminal target domain-containing protein n=1 Tax=Saccharicrinis fermentans DSM 9555 = JCM 21142 TaxID=869213 RepID=W7YB27_9BACT|nr:hypothetical protein [Saccharicrinis fermentans]GAF04863.1 hypothetical protein JCM21142_93583 [Saccharicrinis fermentans DSM 9555 = JCM 21142]